jgi:hypothetical protein
MYNPPANGYSAPLLKQETTIDSEIRGILSLFKKNKIFFFYIRLSFRARLWKISSRSLKTCRETKNSKGKSTHTEVMHTEGKKNNQTRTKPAPKKEKKTWLFEEASVKEAESMPSSPEASRQTQKFATKRRIKERSEKKYARARAPTNNIPTTKGGAGDVAAGGGRRRGNDDTSRD